MDKLPQDTNCALFDSHAHYYDKRFGSLADADTLLVSEVFPSGVDKILNIGTNNENNVVCIEQAARHRNMYAAIGIHPSDCHFCRRSIDEEMETLRALLGDKDERTRKKIVALGEIGLDYHYPDFDKAEQLSYFERQMKLARELSLPVIIHDREAHGDCFDMVRAFPEVTGVFHSFSSSAQMASELVRRGWYISFSGVVTFKNAPKVKEAASAVPLDRILCETDAPYLAPEPHRGQINHSGYMSNTVRALAEIKNISYAEMAQRTYENAAKLFGINS